MPNVNQPATPLNLPASPKAPPRPALTSAQPPAQASAQESAPPAAPGMSGAALGAMAGSQLSLSAGKTPPTAQTSLGFVDTPAVASPGAGALVGLMAGQKTSRAPAASAQESTASLKQKLLAQFASIDSNGNGFIAESELLSRMRNPQIKGEAAAATALLLLALRNGVPDLVSEGPFSAGKGLSKADLALFAERGTVTLGKDKEIPVTALYDTLRARIAHVEPLRDAHGGLPLPRNRSEIRFKQIEQNLATGDCYFVAGLAALASQRPEKILQMIQAKGQGHYTVDFGGKQVTIASPTDTEIALNSTGGTWMPILEKAYAQLRNGGDGSKTGALDYLSRAWSAGTVDVAWSQADPYQKINSRKMGNLGLTMQELTGRPGKVMQLKDSQLDGLDQQLRQAMQGKKMMLAGTAFPSRAIVAGHAYAITNYDPVTRTVGIKNTWSQLRGGAEPETAPGKALDGNNDGYFKMSLEEFYNHFSFLTVEQ